jgi:hypothetical protein
VTVSLALAPIHAAADAAPLVYVAPRRSRLTDAARPDRHDRGLAAAAGALGLRVHVGRGDASFPVDAASERALADAHVVVCHVVGGLELPVEVAYAVVRGLRVVAFAPAGVPLAPHVADLLAGCTLVRYDGTAPDRLLDRDLLGLPAAAEAAAPVLALAA